MVRQRRRENEREREGGRMRKSIKLKRVMEEKRRREKGREKIKRHDVEGEQVCTIQVWDHGTYDSLSWVQQVQVLCTWCGVGLCTL